MAITGKLFGATGQFVPATPPLTQTARAAYRRWYARQLALSYAASLRRRLPLAA